MMKQLDIGEIMIDRIVNRLFRWNRLREALFDEVHMYDDLRKRIYEYKHEMPTNLSWAEGNIWYGWTYNPTKKRYYFDDIGNESLFGLWENQWLKEADTYE